MRTHLIKARDTALLWKQRLSYSAGYFSIISMPLLVVDVVQQKLALVGLNLSFATLFVFSIISLSLVGWALDAWGFWTKEHDLIYERSALMRKDIRGDK